MNSRSRFAWMWLFIQKALAIFALRDNAFNTIPKIEDYARRIREAVANGQVSFERLGFTEKSFTEAIRRGKEGVCLANAKKRVAAAKRRGENLDLDKEISRQRYACRQYLLLQIHEAQQGIDSSRREDLFYELPKHLQEEIRHLGWMPELVGQGAAALESYLRKYDPLFRMFPEEPRVTEGQDWK